MKIMKEYFSNMLRHLSVIFILGSGMFFMIGGQIWISMYAEVDLWVKVLVWIYFVFYMGSLPMIGNWIAKILVEDDDKEEALSQNGYKK